MHRTTTETSHDHHGNDAIANRPGNIPILDTCRLGAELLKVTMQVHDRLRAELESLGLGGDEIEPALKRLRKAEIGVCDEYRHEYDEDHWEFYQACELDHTLRLEQARERSEGYDLEFEEAVKQVGGLLYRGGDVEEAALMLDQIAFLWISFQKQKQVFLAPVRWRHEPPVGGALPDRSGGFPLK